MEPSVRLKSAAKYKKKSNSKRRKNCLYVQGNFFSKLGLMLVRPQKTFQTFWHLCPLQLDDAVWHDGGTNNERGQRRPHVRHFSRIPSDKKSIGAFSASASRWPGVPPHASDVPPWRMPDHVALLRITEFLHLYHLIISSLISFFWSNNRCPCCGTGSHVFLIMETSSELYKVYTAQRLLQNIAIYWLAGGMNKGKII